MRNENGPNPPSNSDIAHVHFRAVTTVFEFDNETRIEWNAEEDRDSTEHDNVFYKVRVHNPGGNTIRLSLLTLGLQSMDHVVELSEISTPTNSPVEILMGNGKAHASERRKYQIPPGTPMLDEEFPGKAKPVEASIYSIRFSGVLCELTARANGRHRMGRTHWELDGRVESRGGHGNMPPGGTVQD